MNPNFFPVAELVNWMTLATHLCSERLRHLNMQRESHLKYPLTEELKVRRFCLDNRGRANEFSGAARVWWEYMLHKAWIEIGWERRHITDDEFVLRARALRTRRDAALRRVSGQQWLPPIRKKETA